MKKIDNLEQLLAEKRRLRNKLSMLETEIAKEWEQMSELLAPFNLLKNLANNESPGSKNNLLKNTMTVGLDVLIGKFLLRNKSLVLKMAVPFLLKKLAGNMMNGGPQSILTWLRTRFAKNNTVTTQRPQYDESTADVNTAGW